MLERLQEVRKRVASRCAYVVGTILCVLIFCALFISCYLLDVVVLITSTSPLIQTTTKLGATVK